MRCRTLGVALAAAAALCPLLLAPLRAGETAPPPPRPVERLRKPHTRDFSASDPLRERWFADDERLQTVETATPEHGPALAVPVSFPDRTEVWLQTGDAGVQLVSMEPPDGGGALAYREIAYDVFVPDSFTGRVQAALLLKDKDGVFYTAVCDHPLRPGAWNRIRADLQRSSNDLQPRGHSARWGLHRLANVRRIGFAFWSDALDAEEGRVLLDNITTIPVRTARWRDAGPLALEAIQPSAERIGQYQTLEITCWINRPVFNPFDQEHVRIDAHIQIPGEDVPRVVPAFFDQDFRRIQAEPRDRYVPTGPGLFRIRFTPRWAGKYTYRLVAHYVSADEVPGKAESCTSEAFSLLVQPRAHPGFIRVSERDPRYFEYENGEFFFPVGHNFRSPYDLRDWKEVHRKRDRNAPRPVDRGLDIYEEYLPRMAAAGENLMEVWMSSWWLALEWNNAWKGFHGLGRYNLENAWKLDRLLELSRRHDIRVQMVIDNHGKASKKPQVDHEWSLSPYNIANGGFLERPEELFVDPRAKKLYRDKFRYIAARWGASPTVFSFELWSELDLTGSKEGRVREIYAHPRVRAWHREMIEYFDSLNHGGQPVSTHYSGHYQIVDPRMVALPQIDYMACDAYHEGRTTLLQLLRRSDHFAERFGKPYLITEFGGTPFGGTWELLEADLHAGLWASWMSRASGTALFWWFEHIDRAKLYPHYRALANYIEGEDKRRGPAQPPLQKLRFLVEDAGGERVRGLRGAGLSDGDAGYAWIYDEDAMRELPREDDEWPSYEEMTALIPGMKSGAVRVEFWDTWSGEVIREAVFEKSEDERRLAVRLPRFSTDIALKLRHVSSAPAGRASPSARDGSGGTGPHAPEEAPAP